MKICDQNDSLFDINFNRHVVITFNLIECRFNLKVNETHDLLKDVLVDKLIRKFDETGVVSKYFVDLFDDIEAGFVVL